MRKKRHNYTPEEKVIILKRHLIERVPVSDLCDEYHLQPKNFYDWQKSNGKLDRFHVTIKEECIRPGVPLSLDDARRMVAKLYRALQERQTAQCHWLCYPV